MCLGRITKRVPKPTQTVVNAWKGLRWLYKTDELVTPCEMTTLVPGKWHRASGIREGVALCDSSGAPYLAGFHVHRCRKDCRGWGNRIKQVEIKGIRTYGTQMGESVIVADYIRIPLPKKRQGKKQATKP